MKKTYTAIAGALLAGVCAVSAQSTQSGYFVDGYTYGYQLNPAKGNDFNFVAMPGLGNINVAMRGNLHVSDVLYNINGKTTTFLNPGISAAEVMGNLSDHNKIGSDISINLLSGGFKAWGGYNTVSISARANMGVSIPKSLFSLVKEGISNQTYDISDMQVNASAYAELALGHSRQLNEQWRVGAAMKFLIGGAGMDARLNNATLTLGTDSWTVTSDAEMRTNIKGSAYKTKINDNTGRRYVSGLDFAFDGLNGFGLGLDLGAEFRLNDDWKFSAALLDLGFISWNDTQLATTDGPQTFTTDRYTFNPDDDADNSFKNEWEKFRDDLSVLYQMDDKGSCGARTQALSTTMNIGAEYTLPVYRGLKFGLLNTTRFAGKFTWTDFRLSANVAPCKAFSAGINAVAGTYGIGFGWLLSVHTTGFNMFLGMDRTLGHTAKQGVPLNSNAAVNFGINFPF
ncbi:MAG: hypothetical protein K2I25_04575 [Muribaculaceae bacterium]|nr:hypothetical protein [Muribaculaceae bacterium]